MSTPKAFQLYASFPSVTRRHFGQFLESPYFNTRIKIRKLGQFFSGLLQQERDWNTSEAAMFVLADPDQMIPLNNLLSDMNRMLEKFMAVEILNEDIALRESALAKGLEKFGTSGFTKAWLEQRNKQTSTNPFARYHLERLTDELHFKTSRQHSNDALLESQRQLSLYYLTQQLKTWCELLNRSHILALSYEEHDLQTFQHIIDSALELVESNPLTRLYHAIFQWLLHKNDDSWYTSLKEHLFPTLEQTEPEEAKEICAYLQNYCVLRINEGKPAFLQELFNLFRFMIDHELVLDGPHISQWTYKNIVTVGLRLKAFEETESFIHTWYTKLPPNNSDNAYHYNLAAYYYASNHYANASKLLNKVHFTDPVYYLDSHAILMKIYVEETADEALESLFETVRIYLLRQKLLGKAQVNLYRHMFRITRRLYHLKNQSAHLPMAEQHKRWRKLSEDLDAQPAIANRSWLSDQLEAIRIMLQIPFADNHIGDRIEEGNIH